MKPRTKRIEVGSANTTSGMTYKDTGVSYDDMDPWKKAAQTHAAQTDNMCSRLGLEVLSWTRGESVFGMKDKVTGVCYGSLIEGLGTKNEVADAMRKLLNIANRMFKLTGKSFYDKIAQCNVAMAVNDLITLNFRPVSYSLYVAVGDSAWFADDERCQDLAMGTRDACIKGRLTWGGGESPTLVGVIHFGHVELAGSVTGIAPSEELLFNPSKIREGDAVFFVESSGIHANGLTLARRIADRKDSFLRKVLNFFSPAKYPLMALPDGYLTKLSDGQTYGEALLEPTHIYSAFVEDCVEAGVEIHYTANITGHGLRKIMRALRQFRYVITRLPQLKPLFEFIQKHGPVSDKEAYGNLNMGVGFVLFIPPSCVDLAISIAVRHGFVAYQGGTVEVGPRSVVLDEKGIEYAGETLAVR